MSSHSSLFTETGVIYESIKASEINPPMVLNLSFAKLLIYHAFFSFSYS